MMPTPEPGDLVLVKSRGRVFAAGRWIGGNPYDHIGVVVSDGQTLNIDKPRARLLPVERLLREAYAPLVLRPVWPSRQAQGAFVAWIEQLAGRDYDVRRTLHLIGSLVLRRITTLAWRLRRPAEDQRRWICTDAVLLGLERFAWGADALAALPLDWNVLGAGTTNDFLVIRDRRPDLLRAVG